MRILLMDDEDQVRVVSTRILEFLGHDVTGVADGQEAVDAFRQAIRKKQKFDLVILDIMVDSGMGGRETLQEILDCDPEALAVASSGFSDFDSVSGYQSDGFKWFLPKPVSLDVLQATLMEIQRHIKSIR